MSHPGGALSPLQLERALRRNIVAGAFGTLFFVFVWPQFLTSFVVLLGGSPFHVGLITTLPLLAFPLQIVSALLVERLPSRRLYWCWLASIHRCAWFLIALCAWAAGRWWPDWALGAFFVLFFFSHATGSLSAPAWFSWMADLVPPDRAGRFWAKRAMWHQSVAMCGVLVGRLADVFPPGELWPFALLFFVAAIVGQADIFVHASIPEPPMQRSEKPPRPADLAAPLADRNFRRFLTHQCCLNFSGNVANAFLALFFLEHLRLSQFQISLFMAVMLLVRMGVARFWGFLCDRFGSRPVLSLCDLVLCFFPASLIVIPKDHAFAYILGVHAVAGLFNIGIEIAAHNLLLGLSPRKNKSLFVAAFFSAFGLVAALGPLAGGALLNAVGERTFQTGPFAWGRFELLFLASFLLRFANLPLGFFIREPRSKGTGILVRRLIESNPFRVVHYSYVLSGPSGHGQRIEAVEALGQARSSIATSDLITALQDPSLDVRRESARALGRIGDAEAVEPLIQALQTPETMIADEAARALGRIGDRRAAQALMDALQDPQARREAAQALGDLGDPASVPALRALLSSPTEDSMTKVLVAEALARIGEPAALEHVVPLLANTRQPILRGQLALAVARFFGDHERFYRLLHRELLVPGAALSGQVEDLVRDRDTPPAAAALAREGLAHYQRNEWSDAGVRFICAALVLRGRIADPPPEPSTDRLVGEGVQALARLGDESSLSGRDRVFWWVSGLLTAGHFSRRHEFGQEEALLCFFLMDRAGEQDTPDSGGQPPETGGAHPSA